MSADKAKAVFAVVGHPNKGKSSIVATLAKSDDIQISQRSGTTTRADAIVVKTKHSSYGLIDTPGFQRPSKVLKWLKAHCNSAANRAATVAEFLADEDCQRLFKEEVELLTPLVQGAAILYVVDGSRPYGVEYEAEMEILLWTGQPSMALINPIENETHVDDWSSALAQYFKIVRLFNPMTADFQKQLKLLEAFAHLKPQWATTIATVTQDLSESRDAQLQRSAKIIAAALDDLCNYQASQKVVDKPQAQAISPLLEQQFKQWMHGREKQAIDELLALYKHHSTALKIAAITLPPSLFDTDFWYMWGLNKQQLSWVSAASGAAAGAAIDVAVAGSSLFLGMLGGGVVGYAGAVLGSKKLAELKLRGIPLGGYEACYGPIAQRNFPYVIIGRFLFLHQQISRRNHANRQGLEITSIDLNRQISSLEKSDRKALHHACARLCRQKQVENLDEILLGLLHS